MIERGGVPRAAEWIAENDTLVSRRGHRIAFRRRGVGPTVLLLHGFPTWSYDYAEVASRSLMHYRCVGDRGWVTDAPEVPSSHRHCR